MDLTPNLRLPYLMAAQAQKHVTHNDALRALDAMVQVGVADRHLTSPPGSPANGDRYIVADGASGAWSGMSGRVAAFQDGAWEYYAPREGWLAWVADEDLLYVYNGTGWVPTGGGGGGGGGSASSGGGTNPSLLINGDFQINQRAFAGGALTAGSYGHDRWKAATGGANYTISGFVVTLASGTVEQVIETGFWGYASLASTAVTVSLDTPSADMTVTVGSTSGTITAGSGRRSVTLTTGAGDTGNISVKLAKASGSGVTFGRVKVEVGSAATAWQARPAQEEATLCYRYLPFVRNASGGQELIGMAFAANSVAIVYPALFAVPPRVPPTGIIASAPSTFLYGGNGGVFTPTSVAFASSSYSASQINFVTSGLGTGTSGAINTLSGGYILWTGCEL